MMTMSKECPTCGLANFSDEKYCIHCNSLIQPLDEDISEIKKLQRYDLPEDLIQKIIECSFVEQVQDNCIIYFNGVVDTFKSPESMMYSIQNGDGLSEMAEDIHTVILDDKPCKISRHNTVVLFKPDNFHVSIQGYVSNDDLNSAKVLVVMEDITNSLMKFSDAKELAVWIDKNGGEGISFIFIDQEYHDYEVKQFIKIADTCIEYSDAPF